MHNLSVIQLRQSGTYCDSKVQADYLRRVARECGLTLTAHKQNTGGWLVSLSPTQRRRKRRRRTIL
jgi:hypothetical protein